MTKVYTKIVLDMNSGAVERDDWHDYDGPLAHCGSGSKTVVQTAQPTEEELQLQRKQVQLAEKQLEIIQNQITQQETQFEAFAPFLEQQVVEFERRSERAQALEPITDELLQLELENIRRGAAASPEQIRLIEEASASALATGESDISKFQTDALGRLREELAGSLGLRPTDTPILDRGARITEESVRQQGQLARNLSEARFTSQLNFPLGASQLQSAQTQFQQGLTQQVQQFQAQLRDAAFSNRLRLAATQGGLGVRLAEASRPSATIGTSGNSTQTTSGGGGLSFGRAIGIGANIAGLFALSHPAFKDIEGDIDIDAILAAVMSTPVKRWRYKDTERDHIGIMADAAAENIGIGDGVTLHMIDMVGVLWAAVQAQQAQIEELKSG